MEALIIIWILCGVVTLIIEEAHEWGIGWVSIVFGSLLVLFGPITLLLAIYFKMMEKNNEI